MIMELLRNTCHCWYWEGGLEVEGHNQFEWRRMVQPPASLVLLEITNLFIPAPAGVQFMIVISYKSSVRAQTETT